MEHPSFKNYMKVLVLDLFHEPKHGYGIMSELEERYGIKPSAGTIYPIINSLRRKGLIEIVGTGNREKKLYLITEKGKEYLREHSEELEEVRRRMRAYRTFLDLGGNELKLAFKELFESIDDLTEEQKARVSGLLTECARELRLILLGGE